VTDPLTFLLVVLALTAALVVARTALRARAEITTAYEAWDNGCQHGIDLAHRAVAGYRKPWITLTQEQGWDLARTQLLAAIDELRTPDPAQEPTP
jgi:hypothetical protein